MSETRAAVHDAVLPGRVGRLALLFLAHALGTATITLVVATAPAIEQALAIGHAGFGIIVSSYYGSTLVLALPAGWLVDRFGVRSMLLAANGLLALGMGCFAYVDTLATAALAMMLCGAGYALVNPATARSVLMWFPMQGRATAMSIKQAGVPAGGAAVALVAGSAGADWRSLALGIAAVTIVVAAGYSGLGARTGAGGAPTRLADIRKLLGLRRLAQLNLGLCCYAIGQSAFFAYLVLFARDALALPAALASMALAVGHVASGIGRIGWGIVSDRLLGKGRIFCLVAVGLIAASGGVLFTTLPAHGAVAVFFAAAAILGASLGGYAGLSQTAAVEAVEARQAGAAIGYNILLTAVGTMLGPALFGIGVQSIGYVAAWGAMSAVLAAGALLLRAAGDRTR